MITALLLLGLLLAVVASGFFSGSETGIYCLNQVRLRVAADQGNTAARRLERLMLKPEALVITTLLGTNIADYLATAFTAALMLRAAVAPNLAEVYATAIVTPLIFVFGGVVPKDWFRREADVLMLRLSGVVVTCLRLARATGLVWFLQSLTRLLIRWIDRQRAARHADLLPRTRTLALLREGAAAGGLTVVQRDLIERVLRLSEVTCADVMVPRARAALVPVTISREDFLRIARMAHFSRLPVFDVDPRRIVGTVNVYDVLTDPDEKPVSAHARRAVFVPQRMRVPAALLRLQRSRQTMAIVQDEQEHCVGLLTIKDLVEEIVGELEAW
jgi:CBS domain containing-hemolysin-like protein